MQKNCFKVTPFWDRKALKTDGTSRIMITINLNRQQFRVTVKLRATHLDYLKAIGPVSRRGDSEDVVQLRKDISEYINRAERILLKLNEPNKDSFLRLFKSEFNLSISNKTDVYIHYESKILLLERERRFGSVHTVRCSMNSFKSFSSSLFFEDIDINFLNSYKRHMLNKGSSLTTIGIYVRELRTMYNQLVRDGFISDTRKPFQTFTTGSVIKSKKVLYPEQLKLLWEYEPIGLRESRAKANFFFCYLCNGMNFTDVAYLKYKNISGDILSFIRHKTRNTKHNNKTIQVYLHSEVKKIIDEFGTQTRKLDDYLFPMFNKCKSPKHFNDTLIRYKRTHNIALRKIGVKLGFEFNITLGLARHSYATMLKLKGTPISFISESMGHSSMEITEHYLKSLPSENLKVMSNTLLDF